MRIPNLSTTVTVTRNRKSSLEDDIKIDNAKRRRTYPVGDRQVHISKRKRSLDEIETLCLKRRRSDPGYVSRLQNHDRKPLHYDASKSLRTDVYSGQSSRPNGRLKPATKRGLSTDEDSHAGFPGGHYCGQCKKAFATEGRLDIHTGQAHGGQSHLNDTRPTEESMREQSVTGDNLPRRVNRNVSIITIDEGSPVRQRKRKPSVIVIEDDNSPVQASRHRSSTCTCSRFQRPTRQRSVIIIEDDSPSPKRHDRPKKPRRRALKSKQPRAGVEEVFPCCYCDEVFDTMGMNQEHMAQFHAEEFSKLHVRCWECSFRFRSIQGLDKHVKEMHTGKKSADDDASKKLVKVDCFVCSGQIVKSSIRQHIRDQHPRAWNATLKLDKLEKRYCAVCDRLIQSEQQNLRAHIRKEHPQLWKKGLTEQEMLDPGKKEAAQWAHCPVCHKRYTAQLLERHMELMHGTS